MPRRQLGPLLLVGAELLHQGGVGLAEADDFHRDVVMVKREAAQGEPGSVPPSARIAKECVIPASDDP